MAKRGRQTNLSFFAFTATPKHKTLAVFGRDGQAVSPLHHAPGDRGRFILDVLRNYTTYAPTSSCSRRARTIPTSSARRRRGAGPVHEAAPAQHRPEDRGDGRALPRLHPPQDRRAGQGDGGHRLTPEAVRYKQSFDRYIQEKGYAIKSLVAFSGTVQDDKLGRDLHRRGMNHGVREKELPEKFASQEYQVLLVAEKYQTGLRPAAAAHDVRRQAALRDPGRADAVPPESHPSAQGRHLRPRLRERPRGDPRSVQDSTTKAPRWARRSTPRACTNQGRARCVRASISDEEVERFCAVYFKPKQRNRARWTTRR
jgi:type I restriction enzyme R subunit